MVVSAGAGDNPESKAFPIFPIKDQKYGHIRILVKNAMVSRLFLKPFLGTTWDDFTEKFSDEIKTADEVTRAVLPDMIKSKLWSNYICCNWKGQIS